ncbi:Kmt5a [Symbiodinium sp. KB8]|nr:Kmt5a [Symbiodinium sp. KB8]
MTPEEKREHLRATLPTKLAMEVESIEGGRIACPCCMKAFQQASRQGDEDLYVKSSGREASIRQMIRDKHVVKLAIRHHPEKGRILVAVEDIPEGTFIMEYGGQLISGEEAVRREAAYNHAGCGSYMYFFEHNGRQHCVDATAEISSYGKGRLLSHSRAHQNLRPGKTTMLGVPRLYFTASQHIPAGTELQYDYGERDAKVVEQLKWLAE